MTLHSSPQNFMFISAFSSPTSTPKWPIKELLVLCRQPATRLQPPLSTAETSQLQVATSVRIRGAAGQQKELMVSAASLRGTPFCSGHPWGSRVAQGAVGRASMSSAFVTVALVITRYNWLSIASYLSRSLTKQKTTLAVASCTCLISPQSFHKKDCRSSQTFHLYRPLCAVRDQTVQLLG